MAHDHSMHDHSMHTASTASTVAAAASTGSHAAMSHSMAMTFSWSFETTILLTSLKTTGPTSMFFLCAIMFALSFGHEYLQYTRSLLESRYAQTIDHSTSGSDSDDAHLLPPSNNLLLASLAKLASPSGAGKQTPEQLHFARTVYHVVSSFTSLVIMTVFMTLNMWLVLAILGGTGTGFYMFQRTINNKNTSKGGLQCH
ncbi:hypothetical protein HDU99_000593 [Rhizoclosmatium hyalinum]|nr:hypothetical protein HDU99_000593 [Rhizoclosmatium hyalinum]